MAKAKRYSTEQVREAQKFLRGLEAKNAGKTRAEAVEVLADDIRKAAKRGYSLKEIREVLGKAGIVAPLSRMKALLETTDGKPEQKVESKPGGGGVSFLSADLEKERDTQANEDGGREKL